MLTIVFFFTAVIRYNYYTIVMFIIKISQLRNHYVVIIFGTCKSLIQKPDYENDFDTLCLRITK